MPGRFVGSRRSSTPVTVASRIPLMNRRAAARRGHAPICLEGLALPTCASLPGTTPCSRSGMPCSHLERRLPVRIMEFAFPPTSTCQTETARFRKPRERGPKSNGGVVIEMGEIRRRLQANLKRGRRSLQHDVSMLGIEMIASRNVNAQRPPTTLTQHCAIERTETVQRRHIVGGQVLVADRRQCPYHHHISVERMRHGVARAP